MLQSHNRLWQCPLHPPHESAERRPPRTMEEILKVFDDDLLTAVQSVIDLIVGLIG